jgi:hypothetical protein
VKEMPTYVILRTIFECAVEDNNWRSDQRFVSKAGFEEKEPLNAPF